MGTFRAACSELNAVITYFCFLVAGSNHFGIAGWYSMRAMEHGSLVILLVRLTSSFETLLFTEFFLLVLVFRFGALVCILVPVLLILRLLVVLVRSCCYCCRRRCCCCCSSYSSFSVSA